MRGLSSRAVTVVVRASARTNAWRTRTNCRTWGSSAGGKRFLTGWVRRGHHEWRAHFGPRWSTILEWKETFDPNAILCNGLIRHGPAA